MARKNVLKFKVADAQSLAADFISTPTVMTWLDNASYQINIITTDSTGTFKVQASNDYTVAEVTNVVTNPGTWVDLPIGGTPVAAAANDSIMINLNQIPFTAVRMVYTSTVAGTGHCDIIIVAKQIGG